MVEYQKMPINALQQLSPQGCVFTHSDCGPALWFSLVNIMPQKWHCAGYEPKSQETLLMLQICECAQTLAALRRMQCNVGTRQSTSLHSEIPDLKTHPANTMRSKMSHLRRLRPSCQLQNNDFCFKPVPFGEVWYANTFWRGLICHRK